MSDFSLITTLVGGMILVLAIGSKRLIATPVPPTVIALAVGVLVGPEVFDLIDLSEIGEEWLIRERLARLTLGIGLMGVALRVPRSFPRENWRGIALLVGLGMLLMWGICTFLVYSFLGVPLWLAALIGAIITPTDPIAASPIVTGEVAEENLPERLRHTISFESGGNDGLSYLFVILAFLFLTEPPGEAIGEWLRHTLLWQVGFASLFGIALGVAAGKLLKLADEAGSIQDEWRLIYTVALALIAIGAGRLIGSDELLVVFAAGVAFVQVVDREERENEDLGQEAINRFFAIPIFAVIGLTIPWAGWASMGWSGILLAVTVLLFRRIPVLLLLRPLLPQIRTRTEAVFLGWFGPIAVAALYYASMMEHRAEEPIIWHSVSLVICASAIVHGMTGAPLTKAFGRRAGKE